MSAADSTQGWGSLSCCLEGCSQGLRHALGEQGPEAKRQRAWPKQLYFVRHGQSEYNVYYEKHGADRMDMWDAPLTELGRDQATALQPILRKTLQRPVELAVTSPLTRAMQTCLLAMPPAHRMAMKYHVTPLAAEHVESSCDIGCPASELATRFPELDLAALPEVWWYVPDECKEGITAAGSRKLFAQDGRRESLATFERRVDAFAAWLSERPESSIAVFAHADFFHALLSRHFAKRDTRYAEYWMKNCELLQLQVLCPQDLLEPPKPPEPEPQPAAPVDAPKPAAPSTAALALKALKVEIAREQPDLKPGQVAAMAAQRWKKMDPAERVGYMSTVS